MPVGPTAPGHFQEQTRSPLLALNFPEGQKNVCLSREKGKHRKHCVVSSLALKGERGRETEPRSGNGSLAANFLLQGPSQNRWHLPSVPKPPLDPQTFGLKGAARPFSQGAVSPRDAPIPLEAALLGWRCEEEACNPPGFAIDSVPVRHPGQWGEGCRVPQMLDFSAF